MHLNNFISSLNDSFRLSNTQNYLIEERFKGFAPDKVSFLQRTNHNTPEYYIENLEKLKRANEKILAEEDLVNLLVLEFLVEEPEITGALDEETSEVLTHPQLRFLKREELKKLKEEYGKKKYILSKINPFAILINAETEDGMVSQIHDLEQQYEALLERCNELKEQVITLRNRVLNTHTLGNLTNFLRDALNELIQAVEALEEIYQDLQNATKIGTPLQNILFNQDFKDERRDIYETAVFAMVKNIIVNFLEEEVGMQREEIREGFLTCFSCLTIQIAKEDGLFKDCELSFQTAHLLETDLKKIFVEDVFKAQIVEKFAKQLNEERKRKWPAVTLNESQKKRKKETDFQTLVKPEVEDILLETGETERPQSLLQRASSYFLNKVGLYYERPHDSGPLDLLKFLESELNAAVFVLYGSPYNDIIENMTICNIVTEEFPEFTTPYAKYVANEIIEKNIALLGKKGSIRSPRDYSPLVLQLAITNAKKSMYDLAELIKDVMAEEIVQKLSATERSIYKVLLVNFFLQNPLMQKDAALQYLSIYKGIKEFLLRNDEGFFQLTPLIQISKIIKYLNSKKLQAHNIFIDYISTLLREANDEVEGPPAFISIFMPQNARYKRNVEIEITEDEIFLRLLGDDGINICFEKSNKIGKREILLGLMAVGYIASGLFSSALYIENESKEVSAIRPNVVIALKNTQGESIDIALSLKKGGIKQFEVSMKDKDQNPISASYNTVEIAGIIKGLSVLYRGGEPTNEQVARVINGFNESGASVSGITNVSVSMIQGETNSVNCSLSVDGDSQIQSRCYAHSQHEFNARQTNNLINKLNNLIQATNNFNSNNFNNNMRDESRSTNDEERQENPSFFNINNINDTGSQNLHQFSYEDINLIDDEEILLPNLTSARGNANGSDNIQI